MRTLHLLRHAKSSWDDPGLDDHDRPLADRGRKAASRLASQVAKQPIGVQLALCSNAARARQTLDILLPALGKGVDVRVEDDLYGAGEADLLRRLQRVHDETEGVLLVGHNPALQQLALSLSGGGDEAALGQLHQKFPTGALATIAADTAWAGLGPGVGVLKSLLTPRSL